MRPNGLKGDAEECCEQLAKTYPKTSIGETTTSSRRYRTDKRHPEGCLKSVDATATNLSNSGLEITTMKLFIPGHVIAKVDQL